MDCGGHVYIFLDRSDRDHTAVPRGTLRTHRTLEKSFCIDEVYDEVWVRLRKCSLWIATRHLKIFELHSPWLSR